jgi:hypothetical protein
MPFVATMNTPGYLPWDDEPPIFDDVSEAWDYLLDRRRDQEDDDEDALGYSETLNLLERVVEGSMDALADAGLDFDGTGTIYGDTPGYGGDHDLGLAYSVTYTDEYAEGSR